MSSVATTLGIERYKPLFIINQGTAGALVDWLNQGDIVVGKEMYYISQFSTDEKKEKEDINPWKKDWYQTLDKEFISYKTNEELFNWIKDTDFISEKNIFFDVIGSGDVWTTDISLMKKYNEKYGVVCETMECAGAYMAANSLNVPLISIRVISNNEIKKQEYDEKFGLFSQKVVLKIIDKFIEQN